MAAIRSARSVAKVSSVGCTVSRLEVMFTRVARGTTTRSAPMREKLVAIPSRSAQPAMKPANPMPTPSITATPRKIARSRRRPTFCAANRISSQRSRRRRAISLPGANPSVTTKLEATQLWTETSSHLFDDWFDPIEAGIRDRVREFIEERGMTTPSRPHLVP